MRNFVISAFALAALGACVQQGPTELTQEQLVARGEYLVTAIGGCNDCHTPMTPQGPDMTQSLQGATRRTGQRRPAAAMPSVSATSAP